MTGALRRSRLAEAKRILLLHCLDSYLELGQQEKRQYDRLLSKPEYKEANQVTTSFLTRARDEGLREGQEKAILKLARIRFGRVPRVISRKVKEAVAEDELDRLMAEIAAAESPSDLNLGD